MKKASNTSKLVRSQWRMVLKKVNIITIGVMPLHELEEKKKEYN